MPASRGARIAANYLWHVGKRWWALVVGGVGGILTLLALVTSIAVPLWLGITVIVVGLLAAQFLAYRDLQRERDELLRERETNIGPSPFPRTKLERAVAESLVAAREIERERVVQGDADLYDRILSWAGETDTRLTDASAGKLHAQFRKDGLHPPHGTGEQLRYLRRQIGLLEGALRQLRRDERPAAENGSQPNRLALLREQYQRGRALQAAPLGVSGSAAASEAEAREGKVRKRAATLEWAEATWKLLGEQFPPREEEFCPYGVRWGHASFQLAFDEELDEVHGSPDAYLEQKLALLGSILAAQDE